MVLNADNIFHKCVVGLNVGGAFEMRFFLLLHLSAIVVMQKMYIAFLIFLSFTFSSYPAPLYSNYSQTTMFAQRPFVYWSLPIGLALVLGIIWGRRKKSSPPPDDANKSPAAPRIAKQTTSASVPISGTAAAATPTTTPPPLDAAGKLLGKSAPIDINPNRIAQVKLTNQQIDREILQVRVVAEEENTTAAATATSLDTEDWALMSSCSPDQLTGSGDAPRITLNARRVKEGNPIVIKATKPAKISPEHSFVEAKYAAQQADDVAVVAQPTTTTAQSTTIVPSATKPTAEPTEPKRRPSPSSSMSSVQSKDSGKGSTPPRFDEPATSYEFLVKQELVGTILGRKGAFVRDIKQRCQANVLIKKHPSNDALKVACIEGKQEQIAEALKMLRARLPIKRHPGLTMKQVFLPATNRMSFLHPNELQLNVS